MSRSIHRTVKGVYGGKSIREINDMVEGNAYEIDELCHKKFYKNEKQADRKEQKAINKINSKADEFNSN